MERLAKQVIAGKRKERKGSREQEERREGLKEAASSREQEGGKEGGR